MTIAELLLVCLRGRRTVGRVAIVGAGLVMVLMQARVARFSASASFAPQSADARAGQFSGLAAQFGLSLGSIGSGDSPQFFADLLESTEILLPVVEARYAVSAGGPWPLHRRPRVQEGTLREHLGVDRGSLERDREEALRRLRRMMRISVDRVTGIVRVTVRADYPALSFGVAQRLLAELNAFNLRARQSQATLEGDFIGGRLAEAERELRAAEARWQEFLVRNRTFRESPALTVEHDRLLREVQMRMQVQTSLATSLEQARIDAVRATPVIRILDTPRPPARPDPRNVIVTVILAVALGMVSGLVVVLLGHAWAGNGLGSHAERGALRTELEGVRLLSGLGRGGAHAGRGNPT